MKTLVVLAICSFVLCIFIYKAQPEKIATEVWHAAVKVPVETRVEPRESVQTTVAVQIPHGTQLPSVQSPSIPSTSKPPVKSVWGTPRGLGGLVEDVFNGSDNVKILNLVDALRECQFVPGNLAATERAISTSTDLNLKKVHYERYQNLQRKVSDCQTLSDDPRALQIRLLNTAIQKSEIGASALLMSIEPQREAQLMISVVRDAKAGDTLSIAQVISRSPEDVGIMPEVHQVLTLALNRARAVASVAVEAKEYFDMASSWSNARVAAEARLSSPFIVSLTKAPTADVESKAATVLAEIVKRHGIAG